jgi:hypothetical protein
MSSNVPSNSSRSTARGTPGSQAVNIFCQMA